MDANLLEQINNFGQEKEKKESSKGIEVEHPMKNKIKELLPEDYEVLGKINILISTEGPKEKVLHKTFKTKNELNKKELEYLQNMRNLLSYDNENPYNRIISVESLPKESLKLNIAGDYRLLSVKSLSKEDMFKRSKLYLSILIFKETQRESIFDFTAGSECIQLLGKKIV